MSLSLDHINAILVNEDIEGLVAEGAPSDEYSSEAYALYNALEKERASAGSLSQEAIAACFALVWASAFSLTEDDVRKRIPAFKRVAGFIAEAMKG